MKIKSKIDYLEAEKYKNRYIFPQRKFFYLHTKKNLFLVGVFTLFLLISSIVPVTSAQNNQSIDIKINRNSAAYINEKDIFEQDLFFENLEFNKNNFGPRIYNGPKRVYEPKEELYQNEIVSNPDEEPELLVDKWAVVIGIADYYGSGSDLNYPDDDAIDMYNYLISRGFPAANIKLLLNSQATASAIYSAIEWMKNKEQYMTSTCVFFYSGHGTNYVGADGDLEVIDEAIVSYDFYLILDGQLKNKFSGFNSWKIAFIFDSCFSGGMDDLVGGGLLRGRVVCCACKENQYSYDGSSAMQNGVFTYYYMQGLYNYNYIESAFSFAAPKAKAKVWQLYTALMNPQKYDTYIGQIYL